MRLHGCLLRVLRSPMTALNEELIDSTPGLHSRQASRVQHQSTLRSGKVCSGFRPLSRI